MAVLSCLCQISCKCVHGKWACTQGTLFLWGNTVTWQVRNSLLWLEAWSPVRTCLWNTRGKTWAQRASAWAGKPATLGKLLPPSCKVVHLWSKKDIISKVEEAMQEDVQLCILANNSFSPERGILSLISCFHVDQGQSKAQQSILKPQHLSFFPSLS